MDQFILVELITHYKDKGLKINVSLFLCMFR